MFCKQCGNRFLEGDEFCRNCGNHQEKGSVERSAFQPARIEYISRKDPCRIEIGVVGFRIIASIFVATVFPLFLLSFGMTPGVVNSPKEIILYRAAMASVTLFAFLLPSIFILLWSFRAKISFLQHLKNWHIVLIIAGMMLIGGLGAVLIGSGMIL